MKQSGKQSSPRRTLSMSNMRRLCRRASQKIWNKNVSYVHYAKAKLNSSIQQSDRSSLAAERVKLQSFFVISNFFTASKAQRSQNKLWNRNMVLICRAWPFMALYGLIWPCMALYDLVWPCMALYGLVWPCMALYGLVCPFVPFSGLLWSFLAYN